ncbi:molybdenum cofactor synthesis domain protein [Methanothermus fervidus DSM 2088]|uniref:Molybdenum cofactor synthesis domain protein n=1 Tax=Methanothermus fervidus (strain ATCC 43054 / DSM 2088 / JCM 10308 / V24 S) TaxID=523846 RepID=E3GXA8_METFV|nr:MogA/MoaB family molybdenum cofactor biosynthesis protein [Methanothermus fervidus]ADP76940.1 molybdenum cofactor synthesis domain protein [Methanothermus fervidus DSM 2088]
MKSKSMLQHKKEAPKKVTCAVITLSDSIKNKKQDKSGKILINALNEKHIVKEYHIIPDDSKMLKSLIKKLANDVDVIFTTGGTGISNRDITIETLREIFEKELEGFGEIFRYESYKRLGSGVILTRSTAGIYNKTLIFALPGSPNAVKLGVNLIIDELGHFVKHVRE